MKHTRVHILVGAGYDIWCNPNRYMLWQRLRLYSILFSN